MFPMIWGGGITLTTRWQALLSLMVTCCEAETARIRDNSIREKLTIFSDLGLSLQKLSKNKEPYNSSEQMVPNFLLKLWILQPFQMTDVSKILVKWRWNDSLVINTKVSNLLIFTTEAFTTVNWSIDYQLLAINRREFAASLKSKFKILCSVNNFDYFQFLGGNIITAVIDDRGI